jgi:predicted  nucleic acid-binding Zn-ribbon protein
MISARPRRPWFLIVAALLLAVLSAVLWAKWADSRIRAERLQAELKQVYGEAEALRTQAARAQQRVGALERQLRDLSAGAPAAQTGKAKARSSGSR